MSSNNPYDAVPEIDFAPESTEQILSDMVDTYEQSIFEQTGRMEKLPTASREKDVYKRQPLSRSAGRSAAWCRPV